MKNIAEEPKSRYEKITYLKYKKEDTYSIPYARDTYKYANRYTRRYFNCLDKLAKLKGRIARLFLDWSCEQMDRYNHIRTDKYTIDSFITTISRYTDGEVEPDKTTVRAAIQNLVEVGFFIRKQRGLVRVNPEYFCFVGEQARKRMISEDLNWHQEKHPEKTSSQYLYEK